MADFQRIVLDYIQMQIEYSKKVRKRDFFFVVVYCCILYHHKPNKMVIINKVEEEWNATIPKLANINIDPSALTLSAPQIHVDANYFQSDSGSARIDEETNKDVAL